MEKPSKSKNKFLKFLPKAAYSAVTFHNPLFSPKSEAKPHKGPFIIPAEARRKSKNSTFEAREPTSPKVSCMGQIKHKHNHKHKKQISKEKKHVSLPKDFKPTHNIPNPNVFAKQQGRKSDVSRPTGSDLGPSLSQIKRFTSGRDSLAGFDWMAQIAPVEGDQGNYYSDEDSDGEEEVIVPFSAPILVGVDLEPKKEINLWNRRTITQPRPLRVNTL
ncbi:hypothetical protein CEY00_Acc11885 [Actinidia chinensis var. chinensis]|uniref:Syringolide-induced protein 14-1-1 n=1 Tax=Actinidia chinensis var. chinensis TaxID=1590841 RepID=A0A2R6R3L8_ACTCC|nr:hypothetical protein CEY00_Acc11885 [Actinidia chinensis var. chinensis]